MQKKTKKPTKLYCYVDETGQDTEGKLFVVVVIVLENFINELEVYLENCEKKSGRGNQKWQKSRHKERMNYIKIAFSPQKLEKKIFYQVFQGEKSYLKCTASAVIQAFRSYVQINHIENFETLIIVDGLNKKEQLKMSRIVKKSGIRIRKIRGMRDESSAIIRLADTMAGLLRDSIEGNEQFKIIIRGLKQKTHILTRISAEAEVGTAYPLNFSRGTRQ